MKTNTNETPGDYLRRTLKDKNAMLEVARLATEDQRKAMTHNPREEDFYTVVFTTNNWEEIDRILLQCLKASVYIQEKMVWKNRTFEELLNEPVHHQLQKALEVQAIQIREEEANEYNKIIECELQKAREEALEREKQLKQVHMMELDAISCKSIEEFVVWRDQRKQRPNHSEPDQDTKELWDAAGYKLSPNEVKAIDRMQSELDQDTPIEATTTPRKFPSDYCEACGRVTGTEIYTGACGGCFIERMLDQDNK